MSAQEEATINPDGSSTFEGGANTEDYDTSGMGAEDVDIKAIDPAWYLFGFAVLAILITAIVIIRQRKSRAETDDFFNQLDGEKVS